MWTMSKAPRYSTQFFPNLFVYLQYNPPPITVINLSEEHYPSLSSVSDSQSSSSGSIISESFGNQKATSNSKHDSLPDIHAERDQMQSKCSGKEKKLKNYRKYLCQLRLYLLVQQWVVAMPV